MSNNELVCVYGGAFSATYINAVVRGAESVYALGRSLGSTFRQLVTGKKC